MVVSILYAVTVLLAVLLGLTVILRRERDASHYALMAALIASLALETFDWLAFQRPAELLQWKRWALLAEGLVCPAWLAFTLLFGRRYDDRKNLPLQVLFLGLACVLPALALVWPAEEFFFSPDFQAERIVFLKPLAFYFYLGFLFFMILCLFNLEATLANAAHAPRWKIKFTILGAASVFASYVLYYSQGLLYRALDMALLPTRLFAVSIGLLLMTYSFLRRGGEVKIAFSRRLAYKSVVLLLASVYLVGLGLMGEGLKHFGQDLSRVVFYAAAFVAGLLLLIVVLSETVRRKAKLFLQENFYREKYDYRVQWMEFTARLASARSREDLFQAVLSGYCETFGIVGAALYLRDYNEKAFAPARSLEMRAVRADFLPGDAFLERLAQAQVLDVRAADLPAGAEQAKAFRDSGATFAVALLIEGKLDGFILLGPPINPSERYDREDFDLMAALARQVVSAILNLRLADQLARAREMEVMGKVSTFILHDLKNLVYTLSLIVENARKYIDNPDFQTDMLKSLGNTVAKMKVLITQLKGLPNRQSLRREGVDLLQLARETAGLLPEARVRFDGDGTPVLVDREEMQKVVLNLYMNAMEASGRDEEIVVQVGRQGQPFLRVTDRGCGMDARFVRESLFVPFKTTKPKGMGIGLYQCQQIVAAHGGHIEVESEPDRGSTFTVWLQDEAGGSTAPERA